MSNDSYFNKVRAGAPGQPIFFVFHGTGGDENQFFDFGSRLMPSATIVSPRGDVAEFGAARFFRRKAEGVYDLDDLDRATRKMADFVAAHRDENEAGMVVGLGFSNGANILANLLIEFPDLFDAAVLMHPLIPFEPKSTSAKHARRVLITAGESDPIGPKHLTVALADHFKAQGDEVTLDWHAGGHEIRSNEIEATRAFVSPYV